MPDIVAAMDRLKKMVKIEEVLREAADIELRIRPNGPMRYAHDQAIADLVLAAKDLVLMFKPSGGTDA